jgi:Uma2 family endonuclease
MQVVLPDQTLPVKLTLDPEAPMSDDEFFDFCMANRDLRMERTAQGEIIIVPPAGGESDHQSLDVGAELHFWAKRHKKGMAFGSSAGFILPTGAVYAADAAWVSTERLAKLTKPQRKTFLPLAPEFVVEVMSPSDRLKDAKAKMNDWMDGGVELAWLIDPDHETVYIYRAGQSSPELRKGIASISGEGPVAGFALDLTEIWDGI